VLAGGAVAGAVIQTFATRISEGPALEFSADASAPPPPSVGALDGGFNFLLVASDTRQGDNDIDGSNSGGVLNDANILLHIAEDHSSAVAISFPRDLVVSDVSSCSWEQLNSALTANGFGCVMDTVSALVGDQEIQFGALIEFNGVIQMADAIGGVDVCFAGPIHDKNSGLNIDAAGTYSLTGAEAVAFLRNRHGVGDGSDLSRGSAQQVYLSSLMRKVTSSGVLTNITQMSTLAQAALANLQLTENLQDPWTLVQLGLVFKDIPLNRINFVQWPTNYVPNPNTDIGGNLLRTDKADAKKLIESLRTDEPFTFAKVGDDMGSTLDPDGALTADQAAHLADNSDVPVLSGVSGQSAADFSCAVPFKF
jgi:LCP family protein required for cell wall assembly